MNLSGWHDAAAAAKQRVHRESKEHQGCVTREIAPRSSYLQSLSVKLAHALAKSLHPA
jgi:hypothetical protein